MMQAHCDRDQSDLLYLFARDRAAGAGGRAGQTVAKSHVGGI
jgi:hypothetical protein